MFGCLTSARNRFSVAAAIMADSSPESSRPLRTTQRVLDVLVLRQVDPAQSAVGDAAGHLVLARHEVARPEFRREGVHAAAVRAEPFGSRRPRSRASGPPGGCSGRSTACAREPRDWRARRNADRGGDGGHLDQSGAQVPPAPPGARAAGGRAGSSSPLGVGEPADRARSRRAWSARSPPEERSGSARGMGSRGDPLRPAAGREAADVAVAVRLRRPRRSPGAHTVRRRSARRRRPWATRPDALPPAADPRRTRRRAARPQRLQ